MTTNDYVAALDAAGVPDPTAPAWSATMARHPSTWDPAEFVPHPPARLQSMTLPNGRFLLVLDGVPSGVGPTVGHLLAEETGAAAVLRFPFPVDVLDAVPELHLAAATDEACAMTADTHPDDEALIGQLRVMWAGQAAEAEAWRERGAAAVERVGELLTDAALHRTRMRRIDVLTRDVNQTASQRLAAIRELVQRIDAAA